MSIYHGITLSLTTSVQGSFTANGRLTATGSVFLQAAVKTKGGLNGIRTTQVVPLNVPVGYSTGTGGPFGNGYHWVDGRTPAAGQTTANGTTGGDGTLSGTGTIYNGTFAGPASTLVTESFSRSLVVPGEVTLVGREISRVPEPGSLLLLGSGLAGLAALGTTGTVAGRRLRRARRR